MTDDTEDGPFPPTALVAVLWAFGEGEQFSDPAEFDRRVREYHVAGAEEDTWDPDEIALPVPRVRIAYFGLESPDDDEYTDMTVDLAADNGTHFTARELLLKINNAVAAQLDGVDHRYFEGLFFTDEVGEDGVPVYEMMQGS
jgi:hypothetical protein